MLSASSSSSGNLDENDWLRISSKRRALSCPPPIRSHLGLEPVTLALRLSWLASKPFFLGLLLGRFQLSGFILGHLFSVRYSLKKLLLLLSWFLFGFFLRCHGNLLQGLMNTTNSTRPSWRELFNRRDDLRPIEFHVHLPITGRSQWSNTF